MGLKERVNRRLHNYARLFEKPHLKATFTAFKVVAAISLTFDLLPALPVLLHAIVHPLESVQAIIATSIHPSEVVQLIASGIGYFIFTFVFFVLPVIWGRQVWITDDYNKAEAAAADAERVRQKAEREREARGIPSPSIAVTYDLLGLSEHATEAEIKAAFRRLVKRYHPDRSRYSKAANAEKFRQVQESYAAIRRMRGF